MASNSQISGDAFIPLSPISGEAAQASAEMSQSRHRAIEEAAYWRASERGFAAGGELGDWLDAEANFNFNCAQDGNALA